MTNIREEDKENSSDAKSSLQTDNSIEKNSNESSMLLESSSDSEGKKHSSLNRGYGLLKSSIVEDTKH